MTLDYSRLGRVAQGQMEALEADHGNDETAELGDVVLITVIETAIGEPEVRFRLAEGTSPIRALQLVLGVASTIAASIEDA